MWNGQTFLSPHDESTSTRLFRTSVQDKDHLLCVEGCLQPPGDRIERWKDGRMDAWMDGWADLSSLCIQQSLSPTAVRAFFLGGLETVELMLPSREFHLWTSECVNGCVSEWVGGWVGGSFEGRMQHSHLL